MSAAITWICCVLSADKGGQTPRRTAIPEYQLKNMLREGDSTRRQVFSSYIQELCAWARESYYLVHRTFWLMLPCEERVRRSISLSLSIDNWCCEMFFRKLFQSHTYECVCVCVYVAGVWAAGHAWHVAENGFCTSWRPGGRAPRMHERSVSSQQGGHAAVGSNEKGHS